ncbi:MAG: autotransporter outer membrane beta-barrel domain-containing protein [Alphaproteobacteria bacterium]|nr:autotransporter outer membrane beta-barrel domain-containing protein [Alphaproteobacteria bacterium]
MKKTLLFSTAALFLSLGANATTTCTADTCTVEIDPNTNMNLTLNQTDIDTYAWVIQDSIDYQANWGRSFAVNATGTLNLTIGDNPPGGGIYNDGDTYHLNLNNFSGVAHLTNWYTLNTAFAGGYVFNFEGGSSVVNHGNFYSEVNFTGDGSTLENNANMRYGSTFTGNNNTFTNNLGGWTTYGGYTFVGTGNEVINHGRIGYQGFVNMSGGGNTLTNTGQIDNGVAFEDGNNIVVNSGSIGATLSFAGTNADLTNTGSIGTVSATAGNATINNNTGGNITNLTMNGGNNTLTNTGSIGTLNQYGFNTINNENGGEIGVFEYRSGDNISMINHGTIRYLSGYYANSNNVYILNDTDGIMGRIRDSQSSFFFENRGTTDPSLGGSGVGYTLGDGWNTATGIMDITTGIDDSAIRGTFLNEGYIENTHSAGDLLIYGALVNRGTISMTASGDVSLSWGHYYRDINDTTGTINGLLSGGWYEWPAGNLVVNGGGLKLSGEGTYTNSNSIAVNGTVSTAIYITQETLGTDIWDSADDTLVNTHINFDMTEDNGALVVVDSGASAGLQTQTSNSNATHLINNGTVELSATTQRIERSYQQSGRLILTLDDLINDTDHSILELGTTATFASGSVLELNIIDVPVETDLIGNRITLVSAGNSVAADDVDLVAGATIFGLENISVVTTGADISEHYYELTLDENGDTLYLSFMEAPIIPVVAASGAVTSGTGSAVATQISTASDSVILSRMQETNMQKEGRERQQYAAIYSDYGSYYYYQDEVKNNVWAQAFGLSGSYDGDASKSLTAFDTNIGGAIMGYDYDFGFIRSGLALTYATGNIAGEGNAFDVDVEAFNAALYGVVDFELFYIETAATYGITSFDQTIAGADASFDSENTGLLARVGARFHAGSFGLEPFVGLQYKNAVIEKHTNGVTTVDEYNQESIRADIGMTTSYQAMLESGNAIVPYLRVEAGYDFADTATIANLDDATGLVVGNEESVDFGSMMIRSAVGASFLTQDNYSLGMEYEYEFRNNYQAHIGKIKGRLKF